MKITAIKQQVKRQGRYSIFVEDKYAFSLSDTALLESRLINGQELTEAEVQEFKRVSDEDKLYNNTLAYASLRPRSEWEMRQYLRRKECSPELAEKVLAKLSNIGLVDDMSFARSWVANRRLLKPVSRRKLLQELRAKRVDESVAERAINEGAADERSVLDALISRKRKQARYQDDQKLMRYLVGQGFGYGDIKAALEDGGRQDFAA